MPAKKGQKAQAVAEQRHNDARSLAGQIRHSVGAVDLLTHADGDKNLQLSLTFEDMHGKGVTLDKATKAITHGRRAEVRTIAGIDPFWWLAARFGALAKAEKDTSLPREKRILAGEKAEQLALDLMPYMLPKLRQIDIVAETKTEFTVEIGADGRSMVNKAKIAQEIEGQIVEDMAADDQSV